MISTPGVAADASRAPDTESGFGGFLLKMVTQERGVHAADPG
jgi:hypothetical protein